MSEGGAARGEGRDAGAIDDERGTNANRTTTREQNARIEIVSEQTAVARRARARSPLPDVGSPFFSAPPPPPRDRLLRSGPSAHARRAAMPPPPPVGAGADPARDPPVAPSDAVAVPASARPSPSHDDAPPASASSGAKKKKLGKKERQRLRAMAAGTYVPPTLPTKAPKKPTIARQPYAGGVAPSLLTRYIREAWTPESLLETCDRYAAKMNHIHAGAAWNSLAKLATNPAHPDRDWALRVDGALLERLVERTIAIVPTMGPRELANAAHGVAKSGLPKIAAAAAAKKKTI